MRKKIAILGVLFFGLTGCQVEGYTVVPLYAERAIPKKLSQIYVASMTGKYGVHLYNKLHYLLVPKGQVKYRLSATFVETEKELAISKDDSSARKEIRVAVYYTLTYLDGSGKESVKFSTIGVANYTASSTPYMTEISRDSAYKDALSSSADTAVLRLSVLLRGQ